jgi:TetR/AcrR family transcriptional regulator, ethionamide resistance regulator
MDSPRSRSGSRQRPRRARTAEALRRVREPDRPRRHDGTSAVELTIFEATETLLSERSLHDLSVAQIIAEAGVSRATFYFYFGSKFAVAASLLARVIGEIFGFVQPYVNKAPEDDPREALARSLQAAIDGWQRHRPILRAAHEHWSTNDEIGRPWLAGIELFTEAIAAQIDRDRAGAIAPAGPGSRELAAALLWGTLHILYAAGLNVDADLAGEQTALGPLVTIWTRSIYGSE